MRGKWRQRWRPSLFFSVYHFCNNTIVHPREVFGDPLSDRAAAVIVCHNHPSGQLEPSDEDRNITRRLYEAGELLGIALLDHLILSPRGGYFSFVESGTPIS